MEVTSLPSAFWSKVNKQGPQQPNLGPCWLWTAYINPGGYGMFNMGKKKTPERRPYLVHRLVLALKLGRAIGPGLDACHVCDVRSCVNPEHLWEGTRKENMADCVKKGRQSRGERKSMQTRGAGNPAAKLNEDQVRQIRKATGKQQDIADRFGISQTQVSDIKLKKSWAYLVDKETTT